MLGAQRPECLKVMLKRGDALVGRLSRGDGACCLAGADGGEFLIEESVLGGSLGRVAARVVGWDRGHSRNLPSDQVPSPKSLPHGGIDLSAPTFQPSRSHVNCCLLCHLPP